VKQKQSSWSFVKSLPLLSGIGIFLLVASLSWFSACREYRLLNTGRLQRLSTTAKLLSALASDPLESLDVGSLRHLLAQTAESSGLSSTFVFDRSGRILTDGTVENPQRHHPVPAILRGFLNTSASAASWENGENLIAVSPIRAGNRVIGAVQCVASTRNIRRVTLNLIIRRTSFSLVLALALAFLAWRILWRASRPLQQLVQSIDGLTGTGRITPLPRTGPIEIRRVSESFSRLLSELRDTTLSKKVLSGILDGIGDGLLVLVESGRIDESNEIIAAMSGYKPETIKGLSLADLLPGEKAANIRRWIDLALNDLRKTVNEETLLVTGQDGKLLPVLLSMRATPRVGSDGFMIVCLIRDISELKKADEMKARFLATISHELRTPMTSIKGTLGLMAGGAVGELSPGVNRMVEIALTNTDRLLSMINDLLDLEKAAAGKLGIELVEVEPVSTLQKAVEAAQGYGVEKHLEYQLDLEDTGTIIGDPDRIHQIILNLLSNASKYAPENSTIDLRLRRKAEMAHIEILDRGPGVPPAFRRRLFDRFSQAGDRSERSSIKGSGLGLALAKELVERMNGKVGYHDRSGGGACFYIQLPLRDQR